MKNRLKKGRLSEGMSQRDLERIRAKVRLRQYDMSAHTMEEMAEDLLTN